MVKLTKKMEDTVFVPCEDRIRLRIDVLETMCHLKVHNHVVDSILCIQRCHRNRITTMQRHSKAIAFRAICKYCDTSRTASRVKASLKIQAFVRGHMVRTLPIGRAIQHQLLAAKRIRYLERIVVRFLLHSP